MRTVAAQMFSTYQVTLATDWYSPKGDLVNTDKKSKLFPYTLELPVKLKRLE